MNSVYENPVIYADYSDPDVVRVGSDYYMVASSFSNVPGLPVLHSRDLVNWEIVNYVLEKLPYDKYDRPIHGCGVWAPSIRYHEGKYFACFPMPDEGIFMSVAHDPYGRWSEPVMIKEGPGWIDPCPLWDEDGRAYLVFGVAKSRIGYKSVLYIQEMQPDGMGLIGDAVKVFDGNENDQTTIEGPKLYKRNGWYYIFAPAGGVKVGWQTVLRSRNVFGPYEYKVVMRQGNTEINGPHQGAWVDTVTGEDWFIHFQDVYAAGRIVHLQPMTWENDWPVIGIKMPGNDYGEPVTSYEMPNVGDYEYCLKEPQTSDEFDGDRLGLQWQWNANPQKGWYEVKDNRLVLGAVKKAGVYGDIPNLILQKWPTPEFVCETRLDLSGLAVGDEAGMISMGMSYGLVTFVRRDNDIRVLSVHGKQFFDGIFVDHTEEDIKEIALLPGDTKEVAIRYVVEQVGEQDIGENGILFPKEKVSILYGTNSGADTLAMEMIAVPGRWVGVKLGFFCVSENDSSSGKLGVSPVIFSKG